MVAAKKTKKTHESINNRLALVMKSGKFTLGYKTVLKSLRNSKDSHCLLHLTFSLLVGFLNFSDSDILKSMPGDQ
ncbi:unnamed protein product [Cuscuta campestris]|uniref:Ribosomal protein L7Ae/L30e/S12e/Gadd45 domain-containing protein n=1 Tax=Cuscuta campestris TaxID=132261 RepID=A0A484L166_9ASTE|nr:unnamed protein product [Cuscuta campestris]